MSKIELLLLIVFLLLLILLFKYLQTKRQIRNLSKQIAELVNGKSEKMLDISLIDKDLEQLAGILNQYNDNQRQLIASTLRHENYLKESIANISHDLRTPLTVILGHLQLLRKETLTDKQEQRIETIFHKAERMKELVQTFYDLSILDAEQITPRREDFNLSNLLINLITENAPALEAKKLSPEIDLPPHSVYLNSDYSMVERILQNLLTNAIRYSSGDIKISNRAEFEALVKKNLAMQQTDQTKKQQKRIPQITTRLEQIDKVLNKLYEDNALGTIPQDRYEQMSQKYSEEYYALKAELATLQEQLSAYENAGGRAQKFLKLTERHAAFTELTPAILNEFISRIEVHERDQKRARYAIQHISIYFNYIGKFENEVTQLAEPTEQEIRQMREEIEEAKKEKSRAYHRQYSREYRARNLEKQREYDRMKAREYRARRKAQAAAAQPTQ